MPKHIVFGHKKIMRSASSWCNQSPLTPCWGQAMAGKNIAFFGYQFLPSYLFQKQAFSWEHRQDGYVTRTARNLARDKIGDDEVPQNYSLKGGRSSKRKEKKLRFNTTSTYKLILGKLFFCRPSTSSSCFKWKAHIT